MSLAKLFALGLVLSYAILAIHFGGFGYWKWSLVLLVPLAFIWFPEEIGSLTGYYKTGYVNTQTPGAMMAFFGWAILLGLPIIAFLLRK